jgi:hypothetical protein
MRWARPSWAAARPTRPVPDPPGRERDGADAYARLVQGIGVRVSVVGTRGKGTLARMAAAALRRRGLAVHCNAAEPGAAAEAGASADAGAGGWLPRRPRWQAEAEAVRAAGPVQALVLSNPGATAAARRSFHARVLRPHYVLLTNVRRDVHGLRPAARDALARDWVRSVTPGATLVSGEGSPALRAVLRRECDRRQVQFVEAAPLRSDVPGLEAVAVLDAFLRHRFQAGLDAAEHDALRRDLESRFRWAPSALPGVRWFDGSGIDDPDSARLVLNHLQAARRQPATLVAHLRRDSPGLARALVPLLQELLPAADTRQAFLSGFWAQAVADRLPDWRSQVHVVPATAVGAARLVRRLSFESQGGAVLLLWDDRSQWPRDLAAALDKGAGPQVQRAAREPAAAPAPKRIARPLVASATEVSVADLSPLAPPLPLAAAAVAATAAAAASVAAVAAAVPVAAPVADASGPE